jgi:hypothetical protein
MVKIVVATLPDCPSDNIIIHNLPLFCYASFTDAGQEYMAARIIVRIELTPGAKDRLNDLSDKAGMTQVAMLSRLVEWFANQPDIIQAAVMGHYPPEIQVDIAKLILKRLASGKRGD